MKPLIDGDILVYESAFACEGKPIEDLLSVLENRINWICERVGATSPPTIYLTGVGNFRETLAKRRKYKGNRDNTVKPFHYKNAKALLRGRWDTLIIDGMEADDALAIDQMQDFSPVPEDNRTIICSRDKDLMQVPGWHYSWECGKQGEKLPTFVTELGWLELEEKISASGKKKPSKLTGGGYKFFAAQALMGDGTDNIPGLPSYGPVKAFSLLCNAQSLIEVDGIVHQSYREIYGDSAEEEMLEQINLVWMVRDLKNSSPILWNGEVYERIQ